MTMKKGIIRMTKGGKVSEYAVDRCLDDEGGDCRHVRSARGFDLPHHPLNLQEK